MAGYEPRPTDISVFKEREKKNERGPDWKGQALVVIPDGAKPGDVVKMEVAFWVKGQNGTMLAGSIKENTRQPSQEREAPRRDSYDERDSPW